MGKKSKGKKEDAAEAPKEVVNTGFGNLYLGDKELQRHGLKTGDGLLDVQQFKFIPKARIVEEIQFMGRMSPFQPFQQLVEQWEGEDILFVWDPDEEKKEDCNFYFCTANETLEEAKQVLGIVDGQDGPAAGPTEEELEATRLEEERIAEEERIRAAIEHLKKPLLARPWTDLGSEQEILDSRVAPGRPPISVRISKPRRDFYEPLELTDFDNAENLCVEIRPQTTVGFVHRVEIDKNVQVGLPTEESWTQTRWYRHLNKITQYEQCDLTEEAKESFFQSEDIVNAIEDKADLFEDALTDNQIVDIFADEFACFIEEEEQLGVKTDTVKEVQTFVDLVWSRNKRISKIDWFPGNNNIVGVSCCENMTFDERVVIMNKSRVSTILLWNLSDVLLKAQMVLKAHNDILTFKFNPDDPNIIVGGLESGQIAMWDLSPHRDMLTIRRRDSTNNDEEDGVTYIEPQMISYVEKSHFHGVTDLLWLPKDLQYEKHELHYYKNRVHSKQFFSIGGDSVIMVWDTTPPERTELEKKKGEDAKWIPLHTIELKTVTPATISPSRMCFLYTVGQIAVASDVGELGIFEYGTLNKDDVGERGSLDMFKPANIFDPSKLRNSEQENDFGLSNMDTPADTQEEAAEAIGGGNAPSQLVHVQPGHFQPVSAVQISPHLDDICLTVGDWRFCVWRLGCTEPLYMSSFSTTYLSCGAWSPTRPSVIVIGKVDGTIDVWDLLDSTHVPAIVNSPITSACITDIIFCPYSDTRVQHVAVGDSLGNLRILEIPRNFVIPLANEKSLMMSFYDREQNRDSYGKSRAETDNVLIEQEIENKHSKEKSNKDDHDNQDNAEDPEVLRSKQEESAEREYQDMLTGFKKKLGI